MGAFERLRALRAFKKRSLPFVKSLEDFDPVIEIGYHQEQGKALTLKQVYPARDRVGRHGSAALVGPQGDGRGAAQTLERRCAHLRAHARPEGL
jgi:hypothetical protein